MDSKTIQKYKNKTIPQLIKLAEKHCNTYIRERDRINDEFFKCISCGVIKKIIGNNYHAGHFYDAGKNPGLRFDERNIHGQCLHCNYYCNANKTKYEENLRTKLGDDEVNKLKLDQSVYKRASWKWNRFYIIERIEYFKQKIKEL